MKKTAKCLILLICLTSIAIPISSSVFFIGAVNFIATNGGITTFADNFTATSLTYPDGLNRFTAIVWNGNNRGNFGVDAETGVNISVTAIARNQVTYTVTTGAAGNVSSYIYYRRNVPINFLSQPTGITGGTFTWNATTHIANVTTIGSPSNVVLTYEGAGTNTPSGNLYYASSIMFALIPLLVLLVVGRDYAAGSLSSSTAGKVLLLAALTAAMAWIVRGWGF